MDQYIDMIVKYGGMVIGAILVFMIGSSISKKLGAVAAQAIRKGTNDETLARFTGSLTRLGVLTMVILAILGLFGIETTSFAAVIGAAGLAVGLAFQGTLSNLASGVMLLVFRPFKVGDVVTAGGVTGKVTTLGLMVTEIDTPDNRRFIVPNKNIFGGNIENVSYHDTRRVAVDVGVDYDAPTGRTREVLQSVVDGLGGDILSEPAPAVVLASLGDSAVNWTVRVWVPSGEFFPMTERLNESIKTALDEAGIGIPYPQMDVHVDGKLG
ncbi:MAG: mechanosensitive ion channel family protein [Bradymonadia bacterium]